MIFGRIFVIALATFCSVLKADVIDFEGYAPNSFLGGVNVTEFPMSFGEYDVYSPLNGSSIWNETSFYVENSIYPDSGSDWLFTDSVSLQRRDENVFSLISADISEYPFSNSLSTIDYILINERYSVVKGSISLNNEFGFETMYFDSLFRNIRQLSFSSNVESFGIDNISLTTVDVAEPNTISLFLLGIFPFVFFRKKFHK